MNILVSILQDEFERSKRMLANNQRELNSLGKGSYFIRTVQHRQYLYRIYRDEHAKVISKYIGSVNAQQLEEISLLQQRRLLLKNEIKELKVELKQLSNTLRNYKIKADQ